MDEQDYKGQSGQVGTVGVIEIPALADPLEREELTLDEIRERCGYSKPTTCTICNHPKCAEIEQAIMTKSSRWVAQEYGVGRVALQNHMHNHFAVPE